MSSLIVVDTNILISALMSDNQDIVRILSGPDDLFVSPNFAIVELFQHSPRIQEASSIPQDELLNLLGLILAHVRLRDDAGVSIGSWAEASRLCSGVDPKDLPFVALAVELNGRLWTRDRRLILHLVRNGFDRFYDPNDD